VATMRASEYAARTPGREQSPTDAEWELRRAEREVLDQAARVNLARRFSGPERERAAQRVWDPRIADAMAHVGTYGLAEYIAAGPRLWQRWRNGMAVDNPPERLAGAAIVAVAVDCRRAGFTRPVPKQMLSDLYGDYLDAPVARRLAAEAFAAGLAWATQPIQATSALLMEQEQGYVAFDYLVDRVQAESAAPPVPEATWKRLLRDLNNDDAFLVGLGAVDANRQDLAEQAWRRAADVGHHAAEFNLGLLFQERGDLDQAIHWWRKAAEAGDHDAQSNLGVLLAEQGQDEEAEHWFRKAVNAGHHRAETNLGTLLAKQGQSEEAESWLHKAADAGEHDAEYSLGLMHERRSDLDQAQQWYRKAADAGHQSAEFNLGLLLVGLGHTEEAGHWWRIAANAGHYAAQYNLALLLEHHGDLEEAKHWYRKAAETDDADLATRAKQALRNRSCKG
jgi:uncharacterized protein